MTWWHSQSKNPDAGFIAALGAANIFIVVSYIAEEQAGGCAICAHTCEIATYENIISLLSC